MNHPLSLPITPETAAPELEDEQLLARLRELWRSHRRQGLVVRHETGMLLNRQLGNPGQRSPYGAGVVKQVAEELKIAVSDISRFRRFAARYPTLEAFEQQHPEVNSWTGVRELIAKPRRRVTGNRTGQGILRSVRSVIAALDRLEKLSEPKAAELHTTLEELIEVVNRRLNGTQCDNSTPLGADSQLVC